MAAVPFCRISPLKASRTSIWDQQLGPADHGHGRHDPLQLAAADLVGVEPADGLGARQVELAVQLDRPRLGFLARHQALDDRDLGHLAPDGERAVEGRRRALRDVGDLGAAHPLAGPGVQLEHVLAVQEHLAALDPAARPGVGQDPERDRGLARAGFADQRDMLSATALVPPITGGCAVGSRPGVGRVGRGAPAMRAIAKRP
jgi:hypothetical protein